MVKVDQRLRPPLLAVELHYFGVSRDRWELLLARARQLGATAIVARVPWAWHAPQAGAIDLTGATDPRRDLVGFVRLCDRLGLLVVLRPGRLSDAAALADAPAGPLRPHAESRALGSAGMPRPGESDLPQPAAPRPADPAARRWVAALSTALLPLQAPAGPIVGLRLGGPQRSAAIEPGPTAGDLADLVDADTLAGWLREDGWTIALERPAEPDDTPDLGLLAAAPALADIGDTLLDQRGAPALRRDGSARPGFWRAKMTWMLAGAAHDDLAASRAAANLALGYSGAVAVAAGPIARLAERLGRAGLAFDLLDLDAAPLDRLGRYSLIVAPAAGSLTSAAQARLVACANLAPIGDEPDDVDIAQLSWLVESRGGFARHAWADGEGVDLRLRHGEVHTYLFVENRRRSPYNGVLAYRAPDGAVLHVHVGIGSNRAGLLVLSGDEIAGAAIDGDGSEGGWLARGLHTSIVFNSGAGGVASCGDALLLTGPQSGRFQLRRAAGWLNLAAHRLLLSGELLPARLNVDATHLSVPYIAEDERGQTDLYVVAPGSGELPPGLRDYLAAQLAGWAAALERAADLASGLPGAAEVAGADAAAALREGARCLDTWRSRIATLDEYSAAWRAAEALSRPAISGLEHTLALARRACLEGALGQADYDELERRIGRVLAVAAHTAAL